MAHDDVAGLMGPLNNILRDKVPAAKDDTVGPDVSILVKTFAKGMVVDVKKVKPEFGVAGDEPDFGYCVFPVGDLSQTADQVCQAFFSSLTKSWWKVCRFFLFKFLD